MQGHRVSFFVTVCLSFALLLAACQVPAGEFPLPTQQMASPVAPVETAAPTTQLSQGTINLVDLWHFGGYGAGGNFAVGQHSDGSVLEAHGQVYANGLWAHAPSAVDYRLYGQYAFFRSYVLMKDWETCGDGAIFRVLVDGDTKYESDVIRQSTPPQAVEVNVSGAQELRLVVDSGVDGNEECDWGIWGDPHLVFAQQTVATEFSRRTEFFVAPDGSDANPGTLEQPFATLERARDAVRANNADMAAPILVNLRGGVYHLQQPFFVGTGDSGSNGYPVVYQAYQDEQPVLSGGFEIQGWQPLPDGPLWVSDIALQHPRQLFVDGQRATRAHGETRFQATAWVPGAYSQRDGLLLPAGTLPQLNGENRMELRWVFDWMDMHFLVDAWELTQSGEHILWFKQPQLSWGMNMQDDPWIASNWYKPDLPFYLENAFALLDNPGEWYYDPQLQRLYYWPLEGQVLGETEFYTGGLTHLLTIQGERLGREVHDIVFQGVTFRHNRWLRTSQVGFFGWESESLIDNSNPHLDFVPIPAAIEVSAATNISFQNNVVEHIATAGIWFFNNVVDSAIVGNVFRDVSDSAIVIGMREHDFVDLSSEAVTRNNVVSNNLIREAGVEYWGAPGIKTGFTMGLQVVHNDMAHLPYSGISVGGWTAGPNQPDSPNSGDNVVAFNRIDEFALRSRDAGGIYTLGQQPGTLIYENYISNMHADYGCIYMDEGSAYIEVRDTLCINVPKWLNVNDGRDSRVVRTYTNQPLLSNPTNVVAELPILVQPGALPPNAQAIADGAGLQPEYQALYNK